MCLENIDEFAFQSKIQPVMWNYLTMRHICFKMENVQMRWNITLGLFYMRLHVYVWAGHVSGVWSCACGVRCLLSARLQNELGKLMQLLIYLWDLYHRQWCVSWVFLSVLLVELGMTCSGVRKLVMICLYNQKSSWNIWAFHFSASLLCVNHLRGDL